MSNGMAKINLEILALLYCGEFVKTSIVTPIIFWASGTKNFLQSF